MRLSFPVEVSFSIIEFRNVDCLVTRKTCRMWKKTVLVLRIVVRHAEKVRISGNVKNRDSLELSFPVLGLLPPERFLIFCSANAVATFNFSN